MSLALVLTFSLAIFADIAPLPTPTNDKKNPSEQGTCISVMLFTGGVFLLGRWLIKKNDMEISGQATKAISNI